MTVARSRCFGTPVAAAGIVLLVGAVVSAGAQGPHAQHRAAAGDARAVARVMPTQPQFGDVRLVDQDGRATTLRAALDSDAPVMLNFIFTTCTTVCPIMSTGFEQLLRTLGPASARVRLVSISIDPDNDTVEALRRYAERYGAGRSWRLLTGRPEASVAAQRAFGAYRGDKMNHQPATFVRQAPCEPWMVIDGLANAETLVRAWRGIADVATR